MVVSRSPSPTRTPEPSTRDANSEPLEEDEGELQVANGQEVNEICEEYKTWKKNAVFLYDLLVTQALEWPSLTVQWFPDVDIPEDKAYSCHRILLGTHTSNYEQNYLQIAQVLLPRQDIGPEASKLNSDTNEYGGYGTKECRIVVTQRIPHTGEVNRARYMPQKPDLIASKCITGDVLIFDRTRYTSDPQPGFVPCLPTVRLTGHSAEGYGLSWSTLESGLLLSSSDDKLVCIWDLKAADQGDTTLKPLTTYCEHASEIGDIAWHKREKNIFGSVDDTGMLYIWDMRTAPNSGPSHRIRAHKQSANCVDFNPATMYLLATGSVDTNIKLWDLRYLQRSLHTLEGHNDDIIQLSWHPTHGNILSSSARDRRVILWDLTRIGDDQSEEDAEDGVPELLFTHGGHTNRVSDFSWNLNLPWAVASVADDNIIQLWQPSCSVYKSNEDEELVCEPGIVSS